MLLLRFLDVVGGGFGAFLGKFLDVFGELFGRFGDISRDVFVGVLWMLWGLSKKVREKGRIS